MTGTAAVDDAGLACRRISLSGCNVPGSLESQEGSHLPWVAAWAVSAQRGCPCCATGVRLVCWGKASVASGLLPTAEGTESKGPAAQRALGMAGTGRCVTPWPPAGQFSI